MMPSEVLSEAINQYEAEYGCLPASILLTESDYEFLCMEYGGNRIKELCGIPVFCEPDIEQSILSDSVPYDS